MCKHSGQKNPKKNIATAGKKKTNKQKVPGLKNLPGQYMKWVFYTDPNA